MSVQTCIKWSMAQEGLMMWFLPLKTVKISLLPGPPPPHRCLSLPAHCLSQPLFSLFKMEELSKQKHISSLCAAKRVTLFRHSSRHPSLVVIPFSSIILASSRSGPVIRKQSGSVYEKWILLLLQVIAILTIIVQTLWKML